ncbi:SDR family oxidoreductase [Streptomyces sp. NPDC094034]|uniref:SDR family NAD(P)-dependent oxidoreductase n=1 Tax=Streptomyces sp. NPDC094034 TaxID=3155309 RepID=UPI003331EB81
MSRLKGRIAYVTGAGGGIGRAICERFLAEGASVLATDIDLGAAETAVAAGGDRGVALQVDAGDSDQVQAALARGVEIFGALNVLCNVAGGSSTQDARVTEAPEEEFWRVIRLDLFGTFLVCKYGIPELIRAGGGSVINLTSMGALVALPDRDCYTAAKGGVAAMTRSMAAGYGADKIRVNAIAPGMVMTPRVARRERIGRVKELAERHLLGIGVPEDVAHMAVYLASDESRIVTGQVLSVDSGVTID